MKQGYNNNVNIKLGEPYIMIMYGFGIFKSMKSKKKCDIITSINSTRIGESKGINYIE